MMESYPKTLPDLCKRSNNRGGAALAEAFSDSRIHDASLVSSG